MQLRSRRKATSEDTPKGPPPKVASKPAAPKRERKRKAEPEPEPEPEIEEPAQEEADDESEDEIADVMLDGALSGGEDDSDSESSDGETGFDEEEKENGDSENHEVEEALHSDDIPSDEDESSSKIPPLAKGQIPGLDPEPVDGDGEDLRNYRITTDANGNERYVYDEIDAVYDSDDSDAQGPANTIGDIDLKFYDSYPHIGYDINGKKIMRPATTEALDALLDSIEVPKGWTGLTDPATGKPKNLTRDELELIKKLQMNEITTEGYDQYPVCLCT